MNVHELKCTSCFAPIDPSKATGPTMHCAFCGATLFIDRAPAAQQLPAIDLSKRDFSKAMSLTLLDRGKTLIDVIRAIRTATGLGLAEAKHLAESAPCVVLKSHEWSKVHDLERALNDAGATTKKEETDD